jgi:phage-related protein
MIGNLALKPVIWIGSTRRDFRAMPGTVKSDMGYALYLAQQGEKHATRSRLKVLPAPVLSKS